MTDSGIIQRTDLTQYGLGPDYSTITIGDLNLYASNITMQVNEPEFVTLTIEYRGAQDDIRGNLILTTGGYTREQAVAQMKHTLDAYIRGRA